MSTEGAAQNQGQIDSVAPLALISYNNPIPASRPGLFPVGPSGLMYVSRLFWRDQFKCINSNPRPHGRGLEFIHLENVQARRAARQ